MSHHSIASWSSDMYILDRSDQIEPIDPHQAFALDELLCKEAARSKLSLCHIWRHPQAFVLGQRDYRLPHAKEAMNWLKSIGYLPMVRNSGGAAVPLDVGVVNVSLIFPMEHASPSFYQDFDRMTQLITEALSHTGADVHVGEIAGAYCPGDYDMSINGFKFCGIAQRRQLHAYCVHAFVIAGGMGRERADLVRQFYDRAAVEAQLQSYPQVIADSTASLKELVGVEPQDFIDSIKCTINTNAARRLPATMQLPDQKQIMDMANHLKARYETS